MLIKQNTLTITITQDTEGIYYEIVVDGLSRANQGFVAADLFHERVEEAVMNLLRPITNSAATELRKLRRKAQNI